MENDNKNSSKIILIFILVVSAYYFGTLTTNTEQVEELLDQEDSKVELISEKTQQDSISSSNLITESINGLNCKTVSNLSASRARNFTYMTQSHFSTTYNKCYYELNSTSEDRKNTHKTIRVAPDDDWIAGCSSGVYPPPRLFCTQHNVGVITEQKYEQLISLYFTN